MECPVYRLVWADAPAGPVAYETLTRALDGARSRYPDAAWKTIADETWVWVDEAAPARGDTPVATITRV